MISKEKYVVSSLELHLFFGRIMKEHSLFLEAGFTSKNTKLSKEADNYKISFEKLLLDTLRVSNERIRKSILDSGEIFTDFTLNAEKKTSYYTGIGINSKITLMEKELKCNSTSNIDTKVVNCVKSINNRAIKLLDGLIEFKIKILDEMLCCKLFTGNYPLLIEHIIREAKLYRLYIKKIENNENIDNDDIKKTELFWNQIMMEHALFIRGLLDPSENTLIDTADDFAADYKRLLETSAAANDKAMCKGNALALTQNFRDFKRAGVEGIEACQIRSIILPLLADHVLREANHYIRLLET